MFPRLLHHAFISKPRLFQTNIKFIYSTHVHMNPKYSFSYTTILLQDTFPSIISNYLKILVEKLKTILIISGRILYFGILFGPLMISFPIWYSIEFKMKQHPHLWWVHWLVWTLEQSGPTFTKLGQWASSRKDLFPDTICTILSKLQSNIKPHSFEFTKKCIYNAYGKNVDDLFLCLEQVPIGTGSVAQVYKGTLYDGTIVAVKVLHPHVRDLINVDLQIIKGIANGIEYIIPECHWLSLPDEADMFSQMMQQQLDLQLEGSHLNTFTKNFDSWSLVGFPTCINNESKDVLIMSWIDGIPLERFLRLGPSKCDGQIATIGLTCFLKMLILDNHVHSDLHPGNMLVGFQSIPNTIHEPRVFLSPEKMDQLRHIDNPKEWQEEMELIYETHVPFLYFVDVGVTSTLSPKHLFNFIDLFKSITEFDGDMISKLMIHRSKFPTSVIDIQGFSKSMQEFMNRIKKSALKLKSIHVSDILSFVFYTVRKHHVKIDGEYANVAVALMLIEGIGRQLEPDIDLLKASGPFLAQAIRTRINRNVSKTEHII